MNFVSFLLFWTVLLVSGSAVFGSPPPTSQPSCQPSIVPSSQPSSQPSTVPTVQPSCQPWVFPSTQPTVQPSIQPSKQPSLRPSQQPSKSPTRQPTQQPSAQPSGTPSVVPTTRPTQQPSVQPTSTPSLIPSSQPSGQPSKVPTTQPSKQPTVQPSGSPSQLPSAQPSEQPSSSPSGNPTYQPSQRPSRQPSHQPSGTPSSQPTSQPSNQPSKQPTGQPSAQPSSVPSHRPSLQPTNRPSSQPSRVPTCSPSQQPSTAPTGQPSRIPTQQPSTLPTAQPTNTPSRVPTQRPTNQPSRQPTNHPSKQPSKQPTVQPSRLPSSQPSRLPTLTPISPPTSQPSGIPSKQPSRQPTNRPSSQPTNAPTHQPSRIPSCRPSRQPTKQPSSHPSSQPLAAPSCSPSQQPSSRPTRLPSGQPSGTPTAVPSRQPSKAPTVQPSGQPSRVPSGSPSVQPTVQPSQSPSLTPSIQPTNSPTVAPSQQPSRQPTVYPSGQPSRCPSRMPSTQPSTQPSIQPSRIPSGTPSRQPSSSPSEQPHSLPTSQPSTQPTESPSCQPTERPSSIPSGRPTMGPSAQPSAQPSSQPTIQPSASPSRVPTRQPSEQPSTLPSNQPSRQPTNQPTGQPTVQPSTQPTKIPSASPSKAPSFNPTTQPSIQPSSIPTNQPSTQPTNRPSAQPSRVPSSQPSRQPLSRPSASPSRMPSQQPSSQPSANPTDSPTRQPTAWPSVWPSSQPTIMPTVQPSAAPTQQPSIIPSDQPSVQPSSIPSSIPSIQPTTRPSSEPSSTPSVQPSIQPTTSPTMQPSFQPSAIPTSRPSECPSSQPSTSPSLQPSVKPSANPSAKPSDQPSAQPSADPSCQPSALPSMQPSAQPSTEPSAEPTIQPTTMPTSTPTIQPSLQPLLHPSSQPSEQPSGQPSTRPSSNPTLQPSVQPSSVPTLTPSMQPSAIPTIYPSLQPTIHPSIQPSSQPSADPSCQPSTQPSVSPSTNPTQVPSIRPSTAPSAQPSTVPSSNPSTQPSAWPTVLPSVQPTAGPSAQPSCIPSVSPSVQPSASPSTTPTRQPSSAPSTDPSIQPSSMPSTQPLSLPSNIPTHRPSTEPTVQPSSQPSIEPSGQPSADPSNEPSAWPTTEPTQQPSMSPSKQPTIVPTSTPSMQPSAQPSVDPSSPPSSLPSITPSSQPSSCPTQQPFSQPSAVPSKCPSSCPSLQPAGLPSSQPTQQPVARPSMQPSAQPSGEPSCQPSAEPTGVPSLSPSSQPTVFPSMAPVYKPTNQPTCRPTSRPSLQPSEKPTTQPSIQPSAQPSTEPTCRPTTQPSSRPSLQPSVKPTHQPSSVPSTQPTSKPSVEPTLQPASYPTGMPTLQPFAHPSSCPSQQPSAKPSVQPARIPTGVPSIQPSVIPTQQPSRQPTGLPSGQPTRQPSNQPTTQPSSIPTRQPSRMPTMQPTSQPSRVPTMQPTRLPSSCPTQQPWAHPTSQPSIIPSSQPSTLPTQPTSQPSSIPSGEPSSQPSSSPSRQPTVQPSGTPSTQPSISPSMQPTMQPSGEPSGQPTGRPSNQPSVQPSGAPSKQPSRQPTRSPSVQPSVAPTDQPSRQPTSSPTRQPSGQPTVRPTTSRPTALPSGKPSFSPVSSSPTQPGDTNRPTSIPSASPVFNMRYLEDEVYLSYAANMSSFAQIPQSVSYGSFYYKGLQVDGTCTGWQSFVYDQLALPFDDAYYTSMSVLFQTTNFEDRTQATGRATCNDAAVLKNIVYSLSHGIEYVGNCDGTSWRVFTCEAKPVLCINCKKICVQSESCPAQSYIFSNCLNCPNAVRASASAMINAQYAFEPRYPLIFASHAKTLSRTAASVELNISRVSTLGFIQCAAFRNGLVVSSLSDIQRSPTRNQTYASRGGNMTMLLTFLDPDTTYNIYCYTSDLIGMKHVMPFAVSAQNVMRITTFCCRYTYFAESSDSIFQYLSSAQDEPKFSLAFDSYPVDDVVVYLNVVQIQCGSYATPKPDLSSDAAVLPSAVYITPESTSLVTVFKIRSTITGCYALSTTQSTMSSTSYEMASMNLTIRNIRSAPEVPDAVEATYGLDALTIALNFAIGTNQASGVLSAVQTIENLFTFDCRLVIEFPRMNQSSSFCVWASPTQLLVKFQSTTNGTTSLYPAIGDIITVLPGVLTAQCVSPVADCESYEPNAAIAAKINAPTAAATQSLCVAVLLAPTVVASCNTLELDPTGSVGQLGHPWYAVEWSVVPTHEAPEPNATDDSAEIEAYLNTYYGSHTDQIVSISSSLLHGTATYSISLKVENLFRRISITSVVVEVVAAGFNSISEGEAGGYGIVVPQLRVYGDAQLNQFPRWRELYLKADTLAAPCASDDTNIVTVHSQSQWTYVWRTYATASGAWQTFIVSSSVDPAVYILDPFMLLPDTAYVVRLTVFIPVTVNNSITSKSTTSLVNASAYIGLITGRSGVQAIIGGGSSRTVMSTKNITLDASESFDKDYPNNKGDNLQFSWKCALISSTFSSSCPGFQISYNKELFVHAGLFPVGQYEFTVIVRNAQGDFSSASHRVTVTSGNVPTATISTKTIRFSAIEKIILSGTVEVTAGFGDVVANWSCANCNANDGIADGDTSIRGALSPTGQHLVAGNVSSPADSVMNYIFQLSLSPSSLTAGFSYTFELSTSYLSAARIRSESVAGIAITINGPPRGGTMVVNPSEGVTLETSFYMSTSLWSDDVEDLPLRYGFYYYLVSDVDLLLIKSRSAIPYASTLLGAGLQSLNYRITCVVVASDIYGSMGRTSKRIRVTTPDGSASRAVVAQDFRNVSAHRRLTSSAEFAFLVEESFQFKQRDTILAVLSAGALSLNYADCTALPTLDSGTNVCSDIGREVCSSTSNTCGACLNGYVGIDGHSNKPCVLQQSSTAISLLSLTQNCFSDSDCISGSCNSTAGLCIITVLKECSSTCEASGHGTCIFTSRTGYPVEQCYITQSSCFASCQCDDGMYGADCSLSLVEFDDRTSMRDSVCGGLKILIDSQNAATSDILAARALTVEQAMLNAASDGAYSDAAIFACTAVLSHAVRQSPTEACDLESSLPAIFRALSAIASIGSALPPAALADITESFSFLGINCQQAMGVGERAVELRSDSVRLSVYLVDAHAFLGTAGSTYRLPISPFESAAGTTLPQVQVSVPSTVASIDASDLSRFYGMTIMQYTRNVYGSANEFLNSTDASLQIAQYDNLPTASGNLSWTTSDILAAATASADSLSTSALANSIQATFELRNDLPVLYGAIEPYVMYVVCDIYSESKYTVDATCASGYRFSVDCPAEKRGRYNVSCPSFSTKPLCSAWEPELGAYEANPSCTAIDFDSYSTACTCTGVSGLLVSNDLTLNYARNSLSSVHPVIIGNARLTASLIVLHKGFNSSFALYPIIELVHYNYLPLQIAAFLGVVFIVMLPFIYGWHHHKEFHRVTHIFGEDKPTGHSVTENVRTALYVIDSVFHETFRGSEEVSSLSLFWKQLWQQHNWLDFFTDGTQNQIGRYGKWMLIVIKSLCYLVTSTGLAYGLYADDGMCQDVGEDLDACQNAIGILGTALNRHIPSPYISWVPFFTICEWRTESIACAFAPPPLELSRVLILALFTAIFAIPLFTVTSVFVTRIFEHDHLRERQANEKEEKGHKKTGRPEFQFDDLVDAQTKRSTFFRAARLAKMRRTMDFILANEEADAISLQMLNNDKTFLSPFIHGQKVDTLPFHILRYGDIKGHSERSLNRRIVAARDIAVTIRTELESLEHEDDQDANMFKHFLAHYFSPRQQKFLRYFVFLKNGPGFPQQLMSHWRYSACCFVVIIMILMQIAAIYYTSFILGSGINNMLLVSYVTAIAFNLFLYQPLTIFVLWVVVYGVMGAELTSLRLTISSAARVILRRSAGAMKTANALVQHFNPACRTARLLPHLPASRLLISISDFDLPEETERVKKGVTAVIKRALRRVHKSVSAIILLFIVFPKPIFEGFLEAVVSIFISAGVAGLYFVSKVFLVGAYSAAALIGFVLLLIFAVFQWRAMRSRSQQRRKAKNAFGIVHYPHTSDENYIVGFDDDDDDGVADLRSLFAFKNPVARNKPSSGGSPSNGGGRLPSANSRQASRGRVAVDGEDDEDDVSLVTYLTSLSSTRDAAAPTRSRGQQQRTGSRYSNEETKASSPVRHSSGDNDAADGSSVIYLDSSNVAPIPAHRPAAVLPLNDVVLSPSYSVKPDIPSLHNNSRILSSSSGASNDSPSDAARGDFSSSPASEKHDAVVGFHQRQYTSQRSPRFEAAASNAVDDNETVVSKLSNATSVSVYIPAAGVSMRQRREEFGSTSITFADNISQSYMTSPPARQFSVMGRRNAPPSPYFPSPQQCDRYPVSSLQQQQQLQVRSTKYPSSNVSIASNSEHRLAPARFYPGSVEDEENSVSGSDDEGDDDLATHYLSSLNGREQSEMNRSTGSRRWQQQQQQQGGADLESGGKNHSRGADYYKQYGDEGDRSSISGGGGSVVSYRSSSGGAAGAHYSEQAVSGPGIGTRMRHDQAVVASDISRRLDSSRQNIRRGYGNSVSRGQQSGDEVGGWVNPDEGDDHLPMLDFHRLRTNVASELIRHEGPYHV